MTISCFFAIVGALLFLSLLLLVLLQTHVVVVQEVLAHCRHFLRAYRNFVVHRVCACSGGCPGSCNFRQNGAVDETSEEEETDEADEDDRSDEAPPSPEEDDEGDSCDDDS